MLVLPSASNGELQSNHQLPPTIQGVTIECLTSYRITKGGNDGYPHIARQDNIWLKLSLSLLQTAAPSAAPLVLPLALPPVQRSVLRRDRRRARRLQGRRRCGEPVGVRAVAKSWSSNSPPESNDSSRRTVCGRRSYTPWGNGATVRGRDETVKMQGRAALALPAVRRRGAFQGRGLRACRPWIPDMDSNHNSQIQSLLSCR